jgi:aryl-alcohol dehydrogenase-like predicted oxidoreductase
MMSDAARSPIHRREFLQAGATATAALSLLPAGAKAQDQAAPAKSVLPRRPLGKTGVEVTILNQGTWRAPGALDRILRFAYASGVRYFDTAKSYGSEGGFKRWFQAMPEVRKEIFLVTKDVPRSSPKEMLTLIDQRLEALGTDYIDLIFLHALGDHGAHEVEWPKSKEFKETAEAIRKSGKAKFVGFSTHHARRPEILQNAAQGGFVDAIMLQYTPWLEKDAPLNRALDACHKAGIGLVSMKQVAGNGPGADVLDQVFQRAPVLKEKGLSPYQGLLHAIWTDERISSSCVSMRTLDQIRENAEAARKFEPLKQADIRQLRDAFLAAGPTMAAGTSAELGNLTRFLTYHEHHGYRGEARRMYAGLTDAQRDWKGADLAAARAACPNHLDFARLLPEVDRLLS